MGFLQGIKKFVTSWWKIVTYKTWIRHSMVTTMKFPNEVPSDEEFHSGICLFQMIKNHDRIIIFQHLLRQFFQASFQMTFFILLLQIAWLEIG